MKLLPPVLSLAMVLVAVPTLAEDGTTGNEREGGWIAFHLAGEGMISFPWRVEQVEDPIAYGHAEWFNGAFSSLWSAARMSSIVDAGVQTPLTERVAVTTGGSGMSIASGLYVNGTATHLIWAAGDVRAWTWEVGEATGDARIVGLERGRGSFLLTARDFEGGVGANVQGYFAGARANALGSATLDVQRGLVGEIVGWGQDVVTREGPDGTQECRIVTANALVMATGQRDSCGLLVEGAGVHAFTHTGAAYGILNLDELSITGADYWPPSGTPG